MYNSCERCGCTTCTTSASDTENIGNMFGKRSTLSGHNGDPKKTGEPRQVNSRRCRHPQKAAIRNVHWHSKIVGAALTRPVPFECFVEFSGRKVTSQELLILTESSERDNLNRAIERPPCLSKKPFDCTKNAAAQAPCRRCIAAASSCAPNRCAAVLYALMLSRQQNFCLRPPTRPSKNSYLERRANKTHKGNQKQETPPAEGTIVAKPERIACVHSFSTRQDILMKPAKHSQQKPTRSGCDTQNKQLLTTHRIISYGATTTP